MFDSIRLSHCPEIFQKAVQEKMNFYSRDGFSGCKLLHVSVCDTTPYLDKSRVMRTYRALLLAGNMFVVLRCSDGLDLISEDSLILGEIMDILEHAPSWTGLPGIQTCAEGTCSA